MQNKLYQIRAAKRVVPKRHPVRLGCCLQTAALLFIASSGSTVGAQQLPLSPKGSYMASCAAVPSGNFVSGFTLTGNCYDKGKHIRLSSLPNVQQCVGDIKNDNGQLSCGFGS